MTNGKNIYRACVISCHDTGSKDTVLVKGYDWLVLFSTVVGYDTVSYRTLQELSKDPESGVKIRDAIDYFDFNPTGHEDRDPWWSKIVDDVRTNSHTFQNWSKQGRGIQTLSSSVERWYLLSFLNSFVAYSFSSRRSPRQTHNSHSRTPTRHLSSPPTSTSNSCCTSSRKQEGMCNTASYRMSPKRRFGSGPNPDQSRLLSTVRDSSLDILGAWMIWGVFRRGDRRLLYALLGSMRLLPGLVRL